MATIILPTRFAGHKPSPMLLQLTAIITTLVGTVLLPAPASARKIEAWSYDRLFREADVVLIAVAMNTVPTNHKWTEAIFDPQHFRGVITHFRVASIFKGSPPESIQVLHYAYANSGSLVNDGPGLVSFTSDSILLAIQPRKPKTKEPELLSKTRRSQNRAPEYLLFLKKRQDDTFAAVSGQVDPIFSVRAVLNVETLHTR